LATAGLLQVLCCLFAAAALAQVGIHPGPWGQLHAVGTIIADITVSVK
jgi:hypothetical protein